MKYHLFMCLKYIFQSLILLLLASTYSWSQPTIIVPSPVDSLRTGTNYYDLTKALDEYWSQQDSDLPGSGIKPYLRWKEMWKNEVRPDGTMTTAQEMEASWQNLLKRTQINTQRNANWTSLGPSSVNSITDGDDNNIGRINVIEVDPSNPNIIYIGTPGAGVWRSTNDGDSWEDLSFNLPAIGISGIAVDHNNADIIYVTSGDEDGSRHNATGVYKSLDGGLTWGPTGYLPADVLGEIYFHPNDSKTLWLVSSDGLYRTTNGGSTWIRKVEGNFKEIRLKPDDPNTIYGVRTTGHNTDLYISNDAGDSFTKAHTFTGIGGRAVIAVTPANPAYLYIMLSNKNNTFNSIRLSKDAGISFEEKEHTGGIYYSNQSWFDLALAVSDTDPNKLFYGCLTLHRSLNSGEDITAFGLFGWPVGEPNEFHVDIHDIKIFNGKIYMATDGGISISYDEGYTFHGKSKGLNISQIYRIDVAQGIGTKVAGGLQDNGGFALSKEAWYRYHGADGMDAAIDPSGTKAYGLIQYGNSLKQFNFINNTHSTINAGALNGNWVTPLEMGNSGTLYAGSDHIYQLEATNGWTPVNDQTFTDVRNIRVAPDNDQLILFSEQASRIYKSDGTEQMNFSQTGTPELDWTLYNGIVDFDFNRLHSNIIYVLTVKSIFQSNDGGESFFDITGSIPASDTKVGIIHQSSSDNNSLYLATTNAVYYKNDDMDDWELFNTGLPRLWISDIEINNVENHVLISSFGRGVWRSPVHDDALANIQVSSTEKSAPFYPNPVLDQLTLNFDLLEPSSIHIYNMAGILLLSEQKDKIHKGEQIDLSSLPIGTYIVRIISNNHHINTKILKQ